MSKFHFEHVESYVCFQEITMAELPLKYKKSKSSKEESRKSVPFFKET